MSALRTLAQSVARLALVLRVPAYLVAREKQQPRRGEGRHGAHQVFDVAEAAVLRTLTLAQPFHMAGVANPSVQPHREHARPLQFVCASSDRAFSQHTFMPARPDYQAASLAHCAGAALKWRGRRVKRTGRTLVICGRTTSDRLTRREC